MEPWELSPELQRLERDMAHRPLPEAPARLRQRVLDDLGSRRRTELARDRWQFAAAVAAAALLWLNLSMSATQATDFGFRPAGPSDSIEPTARQIRQLVPEFPADESRREAVLWRAGNHVPAE
jgi:hypothetical protein